MIAIAALVVALLCAAAGARRVWLAANATALHPADILAALANADGPDDVAPLRALVEAMPAAEWERELLTALSAPVDVRVALVNEQLMELDYRIQRWVRVPRVCASISASTGFMLASLVLRAGLVLDPSELPADVAELVIRGLLGDALLVVAVGLVGTAFCIGSQSEAKRISRARMKGADALVERLEELLSPGPP